MREVDRLVRSSITSTAGIAISSHFDRSAVQVTLTVDQASTPLTTPPPRLGRTALITTEGVELFVLTLDGEFSHPEYEYIDRDQPVLVRMLTKAAEAHLLGLDRLEVRRRLFGGERRILVIDLGPDWLLRISDGHGSSRGDP